MELCVFLSIFFVGLKVVIVDPTVDFLNELVSISSGLICWHAIFAVPLSLGSGFIFSDVLVTFSVVLGEGSIVNNGVVNDKANTMGLATIADAKIMELTAARLTRCDATIAIIRMTVTFISARASGLVRCSVCIVIIFSHELH